MPLWPALPVPVSGLAAALRLGHQPQAAQYTTSCRALESLLPTSRDTEQEVTASVGSVQLDSCPQVD